jgi:hypothetical protein
MDGVADEDIQQVEGPSERYGDSWHNQRVGDTVMGGAAVREVVERYRGTAEAEVVKDTREAEGRHSGVDDGEGRMRDGERERGGPFGRQNNGSRGRGVGRLTWEEDLGETPTVGALGRGRFGVDSESRGGGGGI